MGRVRCAWATYADQINKKPEELTDADKKKALQIINRVQVKKRSYDYSDKLLELLRYWAPKHRWDASHKTARGYAGGKASPKREKEPTFTNRAELLAALQDGVLEGASDEDIVRMHEMCHRLFVRKGGPGSGHHGHKGIPGQRGGSVPRGGGVGGVTVDLSRSDKSTVEYLLSSISSSHIARLEHVTNEPPADYPGWKLPADRSPTGKEEEALGAYNPGTGTIHLNPNNRATVAAFYHETGHHVFLKSEWIRSESGQRAAKVIGGKYREASGMGGKLYNLGLSRNSVINPQEFGADCWKVYFKGRRAEKQALSEFLGVPSLNDVFGD